MKFELETFIQQHANKLSYGTRKSPSDVREVQHSGRFVVPEDGSIEDALAQGRLFSREFPHSPDGLIITICAGEYFFLEAVTVNFKIVVCGEGRPTIRGSWIFQGAQSSISGIDFENSAGPCITVSGGEVLLENCNILTTVDEPHIPSVPKSSLICTGGLVTMQRCNLGGTTGKRVKDGIVVSGKGRVNVELSKVIWCDYAAAASDSSQVTVKKEVKHVYSAKLFSPTDFFEGL